MVGFVHMYFETLVFLCFGMRGLGGFVLGLYQSFGPVWIWNVF